MISFKMNFSFKSIFVDIYIAASIDHRLMKVI